MVCRLKTENYKYFRKKCKEKFQYMKLSKVLLNLTQKAQPIKGNIDKSDFVRI